MEKNWPSLPNNPQMIRILVVTFSVWCLGCQSVSRQVTDYRHTYKLEFLEDPRSPLQKADLDSLDFFPPDRKALVKARFVLTPDEAPFELPTYSGITRTYRKWGTANFHWAGNEYALSLYENMTLRSNPAYVDYLFLPFRDETNGLSTYGGGRYLNMSKKDTRDGHILIDFNKCYNPWCAYSDGYNCPIPPVENVLPFPVEAGEKNYLGVHKHP